MSRTAFDQHYPTLCTILKGSAFEEQMHTASAMPPEEFRKCLQEAKFRYNELISLFCGAVIPEWQEVRGDELETNLSEVVQAVGLEKATATYRDKLLVQDRNTLEDVQHEVAATARAGAVLDPGSIELEFPIQDPAKNPKHLKNSDISGTFGGQPVRIEVTVLHEKRPDSVDDDLMRYVEGAAIESGFKITLRSVMKNDDDAKKVRRLVEALHEHHLATGGTRLILEQMSFEWSGGVYLSKEAYSPIESVRFYPAGDLRKATEFLAGKEEDLALGRIRRLGSADRSLGLVPRFSLKNDGASISPQR